MGVNMDIYRKDVFKAAGEAGVLLEMVEDDTDLYWKMALSLYRDINANNGSGKKTAVILPVGPVFQYRRFIALLKGIPLDLSKLHCFFMDEYLNEDGSLIDEKNPLSFRGFVKRELIDPMPEEMSFRMEQIHFPHPDKPWEYDALIESLGGIDLCHAGVGINGHLAFNEPPDPGSSECSVSAEEFAALPSRVVKLSRETKTINSNTAFRGAFEQIPDMAVTVGMRQILASRKLRIWLNRPWQGAVLRKAVFLEPTAAFPVSLAKKHPDVKFILTETAAGEPHFGLR